MKVNVQRKLETRGVSKSASFDLSKDDASHIMGILRGTIYSDRILAVLREYSSNAWDAHRMMGKNDVPIEVTMSTRMEPKLVIRDFGPGLSANDVFNVYTQYGMSLKRDTNVAVGQLGIGSKSGFSYADSFTVVSWYGGKKNVYVAVLDESDKGTMNLMHEEDSDAPSGIQIEIAVDTKDISAFNTRAANLFKFFSPLPKINLELPPLPEASKLSNGFLFNEMADYLEKKDG